ncbi:MAG: class I SAM-dependent methyltransferase [Xanthobacteraceae bacterium]|nr:class I SAM-dependent methyltransferase [Xanthobacteraceae bacterium]
MGSKARESETFTFFNILLDDGSLTRPEVPLFNLHPVWLSVERCLTALFPSGFADLRIADLACLEGGYAVEFARMGFGEVVGIEVRDENFTRCMQVKNGLSLTNLKFIQDDVRNLERLGVFDVIFCGGLLYHLDKPVEFLKLLSRCTKKAAIINTHYAPNKPKSPCTWKKWLPKRRSESISKFMLSPIETNEGIKGRWYKEPDLSHPWSSWQNKRSFWPLKIHLVQAIHDAGFPMVFEQYDMLGTDIIEMSDPDKEFLRAMFVGVKPASP